MLIEIRKSAIKDFQKINEPLKSKLHEKIISLKNFPDVSNIKKIKGTGYFSSSSFLTAWAMIGNRSSITFSTI